MTPQDAIDVLKKNYPSERYEELREAVDEAIEALEKQIPMSTDDLISRKAVIDKAITVPIAKIVTEDKVIYRRIVFVEDIENLLPAQHEMIGCKDCKHRGEKPIADGRYWCELLGTFMYYCSDAERRTDEGFD